MGVELRRTTGQVQGGRTRSPEIANDRIDGLAIHDFFTFGARVDMTVQARLVAHITQIDLQRIQLCPPNRGKIDLLKAWQRVVHRVLRSLRGQSRLGRTAHGQSWLRPGHEARRADTSLVGRPASRAKVYTMAVGEGRGGRHPPAPVILSAPIFGAVAQLGERRVRNAEVGSSILLGSTNSIFAPSGPGSSRVPSGEPRRAPIAQLDRASAS